MLLFAWPSLALKIYINRLGYFNNVNILIACAHLEYNYFRESVTNPPNKNPQI